MSKLQGPSGRLTGAKQIPRFPATRFPEEGFFEAQLECILRSNDKTSKRIWEKLSDWVESHKARVDFPIMANLN
jgi:hypothetical protein